MKEAAVIPAEIREQVEGIFDGYGFDQGLLFGAVCAALSLKADHIETLETRVAKTDTALKVAVDQLSRHEPGDSRAVSDLFVALASVVCDCADDKSWEIIDAIALAAREASR